MVRSCWSTLNAHGLGEGLGPILDPALRCEGVNEELYISRTEVWPNEMLNVASAGGLKGAE